MLPLCTNGYGHLVFPEKKGETGGQDSYSNLFEEWGCYVLDILHAYSILYIYIRVHTARISTIYTHLQRKYYPE
jgi:hypothetical protein